jgi:hypothetical protein
MVRPRRKRADRQELRTLTVHVDPAIYKQVKILIATTGSSTDLLLHAAVYLLLRHYDQQTPDVLSDKLRDIPSIESMPA